MHDACSVVNQNQSCILWHVPLEVRQIQSTVSAFAAISSAGTVVTWGFPSHGGDSSQVQEQLKKPGTCVLFC